jgi:hypothetical protein
MMENFDDLLRELPAAPMDPLWAARVRHEAQAEMTARRSAVGAPLRFRRAWKRVAMSSLLAAACVVYVMWAIRCTAGLYR